MPFAGRVRIRIEDDQVFAHHHGERFEDLGWECIYRDPDGRPASRYKRGAQKGIVATPILGHTRLIVTEGVLSALAAAALLSPDDRSTCVAAIGGAWNAHTASCVVSTLCRTAAISVEVAFSSHVPALRAMRDRAVDHLNGGGVDAVALEPPAGRLARGAAGGAPRDEGGMRHCRPPSAQRAAVITAGLERGTIANSRTAQRRWPRDDIGRRPRATAAALVWSDATLDHEAQRHRRPPMRAMRPLARSAHRDHRRLPA
jgi:hypothetical protein